MVRNLSRLGTALIGAVLLTSTVPPAAADEQRQGGQRYYYEDIARFVAAYDRFLGSGDESSFADYLERGTKGLKNFEDHFSLSPEYLAQTVQKYPMFFSSIRNVENVIRDREGEFDAMFGRLQALFPKHTMPSVYFVIGGLRAGGQAGDGNYVMVAAELYTRTPEVDMSELRPGSRTFTPDDIVHIVAHEAAHVIQEKIQGSEQYLSIYTEKGAGTLMAYSLRAGAAPVLAPAALSLLCLALASLAGRLRRKRNSLSWVQT